MVELAIAVIALVIVLIVVYKLGGTISKSLLRYFSLLPSAGSSGHTPGGLQTLFFNTVFMLLGHVAKCDGHVQEVEVRLTQTYMGKMGLTAERKTDAMTLFKQGAEASFDLSKALEDFLTLVAKMPDITEILLVYLVNLARIDGMLYPSEVRTLQSVARVLGFTSFAYDHLLRMIASQHKFAENLAQEDPFVNAHQYEKFQQEELATAYDALGVPVTVSESDLKKAYRKLMSQYHPDKLTGQGVPEFMVKASSEHFQKIQAAYAFIQKNKSLKK